MGKSSEVEYVTIFVRSFRHPKTGQIIRASSFGKKAFPIKVRVKKS
ncbi:MAG: hypothetical protein ACD_39C02124G0011 [uncultured bacterium]|nr:MAG: hypothetical protein ACD_39C02124G0011 [uncultured bacterium]